MMPGVLIVLLLAALGMPLFAVIAAVDAQEHGRRPRG